MCSEHKHPLEVCRALKATLLDSAARFPRLVEFLDEPSRFIILDDAHGVAFGREEPIRFASYNTGQPWWTPAELESPAYGSKTGRRDKWQTSSFVAVERQGDRTLVYFMYFEEP
jgi:hypothetical protein